MSLDCMQELRLQRGLTVAALALGAGVSSRTIRRLEAGRSPRITTTLKVARALGVEWRELVGEHPGLMSAEPRRV